MTKVTIIGECPQVNKCKKIEFLRYLERDLSINKTSGTPQEWKFVELICKSYNGIQDLMFAHDGNRSNGRLFIGSFNDGIV